MKPYGTLITMPTPSRKRRACLLLIAGLLLDLSRLGQCPLQRTPLPADLSQVSSEALQEPISLAIDGILADPVHPGQGRAGGIVTRQWAMAFALAAGFIIIPARAQAQQARGSQLEERDRLRVVQERRLPQADLDAIVQKLRDAQDAKQRISVEGEIRPLGRRAVGTLIPLFIDEKAPLEARKSAGTLLLELADPRVQALVTAYAGVDPKTREIARANLELMDDRPYQPASTPQEQTMEQEIRSAWENAPEELRHTRVLFTALPINRAAQDPWTQLLKTYLIYDHEEGKPAVALLVNNVVAANEHHEFDDLLAPDSIHYSAIHEEWHVLRYWLWRNFIKTKAQETQAKLAELGLPVPDIDALLDVEGPAVGEMEEIRAENHALLEWQKRYRRNELPQDIADRHEWRMKRAREAFRLELSRILETYTPGADHAVRNEFQEWLDQALSEDPASTKDSPALNGGHSTRRALLTMPRILRTAP